MNVQDSALCTCVMNQDTDDLTDLCPLIDPVTALSKLGLRKNLHVLLGRLCSIQRISHVLPFSIRFLEVQYL